MGTEQRSAPNREFWPALRLVSYSALSTLAIVSLFVWQLIPNTDRSKSVVAAAQNAVDTELDSRNPDLERDPADHASSILSASGYIVARRKATASSKVVGRIDELYIEEGMHVEAGQILARLDESALKAEEALAVSQLAAARARESEAVVAITQARQHFSRVQAMHSDNLISHAEFDQAQAELNTQMAKAETAAREADVNTQHLAVVRNRLDDMAIRAPFSGIVISRDAQPGEIVSPSSAGGGFTRTGIGTIVDISSMEVEVDINEAFIDRVNPGQKAETVIDAYADWRIPSHVINIVPTANRQKATVKVRIALDELDARILPDMGVQVRFFANDTAGDSL